MKKRLLALLLGCAMIVGSFGSYTPTAYATESSGTCGEGFSYTFDSETGALTITQTGTDGYMDSCFFQDETDIRSAVLNEGIIAIWYGTFVGCTSLTTVTLPQSLKAIEFSVFSGTDNLTDVYYGGTREQWADIEIGNRNRGLANAVIHCTDGDTVYHAPEEEYDYDISDIVNAEFVKARDIFVGFDDYADGIGVNLTMSDGKTVYIDWGHRYDISCKANAGKYMLNDLSDTLNEIYVNSDNGGDEYIRFSTDNGSLDEDGHIKTPGNFTVNIQISENFKFSYNQSLQMNAIENPVASLETIHPLTRKISLADLQDDMDIIDRTDLVVNYADSTKAPLWSTLDFDEGGGYPGWIYEDGSLSWFVCNSKIYPENSIVPSLDLLGKHRYRVEYVLGKKLSELAVGQTYPLVIKYMGQEVTTYIEVTENETEDFNYKGNNDNNDDNNEDTHTHTPANAVQENVRTASCTENGSYDEVVYCSECRQEISRQSKVIPATGHAWDSGRVVKAATTQTIGLRRFTCTKCHAATRDELIPKLTLKKQTIRVSSKASKTVKYKASALKKKGASFNISAKAKGKVSYKITKGSAKNIKVSSKGKVTLKKGCKKGTYKIRVTALATSTYQKATKTITIKVK